MSARTSIVQALTDKFKEIDQTGEYQNNIYSNAYAKNRFWEEVQDFPCIFVVGGQEQREYHPAGFQWGFYSISIKAYVKQEDPQDQLESLINDIELVLKNNNVLTYGSNPGEQTADIRIISLITDEGLLEPYGIAEINIIVQYQVL